MPEPQQSRRVHHKFVHECYNSRNAFVVQNGCHRIQSTRLGAVTQLVRLLIPSKKREIISSRFLHRYLPQLAFRENSIAINKILCFYQKIISFHIKCFSQFKRLSLNLDPIHTTQFPDKHRNWRSRCNKSMKRKVFTPLLSGGNNVPSYIFYYSPMALDR